MSGFTSLTILALLVTAFVLVLQHRRKVADLELLTARLRKEVDSVQARLRALEGQAEAPVAVPAVPASVAPVPVPVPTPVPPPTPVPQAAPIKVAEVAQAAPAAVPAPAAPVPPKPIPASPPVPAGPAPAVPNTPSWIAHPDGLVAKAKNWLFTGNLVAKLGLLILFLGVSFLLKYVSAQVTLPIELRLAGIAGMAELLLETPLDATQRHYAGNVSNGVHDLMHILNDILDLSKAEAGQMGVELRDFDPRLLLDDLLVLHRAQADRKGLQLVAEVDPRVPRQVCSDRTRIAQILGNLVGNAIKFTASGQVTVDLQLAPAAPDSPDTATLLFQVSDGGIGMTPEQLERVFQPYCQADASISGAYGGTGLGLAICQQLVGLLGGEIGCDSTPGAGSRFTVRIPCGLAAAAQAAPPDETPAAPPSAPQAEPAPAPATVQETEPVPAARILLVEDTALNRQLVCLQLGGRGYTIDTAENGELGLLALAARRYDLVLMDCMMPVMDGYQACQALRARELRSGAARTPVIALTAGVTDDDRQRCMDAGMDDYLSKPFTAAQLRDLVEHWLAGHVAPPIS